MYTPEQREEIREGLLARARQDDRVTGAALTGSAALGSEDRWSDVDVFLGIGESVDLHDVITDWTSAVYDEAGAVHHWDVQAGAALYRVFLLESGLQVDIAFTPELDFGARSPSFELAFGSPSRYRLPSRRRSPTSPASAGSAFSMPTRRSSAVGRGRLRTGSAACDQTLALACLRMGESPYYSRGVDWLPPDLTTPLAETFVRGSSRMSPACPPRARRRLLEEIGRTDAELADRLQAALAGG